MARKSFLAELENLANEGVSILWDNYKACYYVTHSGTSKCGDDLRDLIDEVYNEMVYGTKAPSAS